MEEGIIRCTLVVNRVRWPCWDHEPLSAGLEPAERPVYAGRARPSFGACLPRTRTHAYPSLVDTVPGSLVCTATVDGLQTVLRTEANSVDGLANSVADGSTCRIMAFLARLPWSKIGKWQRMRMLACWC